MKKLRFLGLVIALLTFCIGFSACGNDDDSVGEGAGCTLEFKITERGNLSQQQVDSVNLVVNKYLEPANKKIANLKEGQAVDIYNQVVKSIKEEFAKEQTPEFSGVLVLVSLLNKDGSSIESEEISLNDEVIDTYVGYTISIEMIDNGNLDEEMFIMAKTHLDSMNKTLALLPKDKAIAFFDESVKTIQAHPGLANSGAKFKVSLYDKNLVLVDSRVVEFNSIVSEPNYSIKVVILDSTTIYSWNDDIKNQMDSINQTLATVTTEMDATNIFNEFVDRSETIIRSDSSFGRIQLGIDLMDKSGNVIKSVVVKNYNDGGEETVGLTLDIQMTKSGSLNPTMQTFVNVALAQAEEKANQELATMTEDQIDDEYFNRFVEENLKDNLEDADFSDLVGVQFTFILKNARGISFKEVTLDITADGLQFSENLFSIF